jgi:hypothetical protein
MLMNHDSFEDHIADLRTIERAEKSLQRMLDWIGRHDVRTAAALGISVAMVGALASATPPASKWSAPYAVVLGFALAGFTMVIGNLIFGMFPRIRGGRPSPFFFGSVATMDWSEYRRRFLAITEADYLDDLLAQNHVNALILRAKFRAFSRAAFCLFLTSGPWAVAMALGKALA